MRNLILTALFLIPGLASAEWKLNPYTQRQDYYEATGPLKISTGALQSQIDSLVVDTTTISGSLTAEQAARILGDYNIGVDTTTIYQALNSTASALTAETIARILGDYNLGVDTTTLNSMKVAKSGDTMTGDLALPGLSATYGVSAATGVFTSTITTPYLQGGGADFTTAVTGISLSEIEDLEANKSFTMANKTLTWNFTNPSGGMLWNFTGAAAGHSLEINQSGGNPGADMHLLHIQASDEDPTMLHLMPGGLTSRSLLVHAMGDTPSNPGRFTLYGSGDMAWGDGSAAADTNLYRSAANVLKTDDSLVVVGSVTANTFYGDGSNLTGLATDGELAAVAVSTGANASDIAAIKLSTGTIKASLDSVILSTGALDAAKVNRAGDTMTGDLTFNSGSNTRRIYGYIDSTQRYALTTGQTGIGGSALTLYDWNPVARVLLSAYPTEHGHNRIGHALSLGKITAPTHTLDVTGGGVFSSSVTASAFYGDGSNLSGVIQSTATGYYPLWVATATYALNGGGGGGVVDSTAVIDGSPIGTIIQFSTTTPPAGYLYCDGSYVSTTTYASLFAVTGHRYSTFTVSGSPAVFQLPDFRGMFARGAEDGTDRDADSFRVVGSTQTDTIQGHAHSASNGVHNTNGTTAGAGFISQFARGNGTNTGTGSTGPTDTMNDMAIPYGFVRVSTETRPENIAVAFMIKYGHVGTVAISSSSLLIGGDNTFTGANTFTGSVAGAGFQNFVSFTSSGTNTWTVPAGVTKVKAVITGGGGGGAASQGHSYIAGSGGGGGATCVFIATTTPGGSISFAIGQGGAGGVNALGSGSLGQNTTFYSVIAEGGGGGTYYGGNNPSTPGLGGACSGGTSEAYYGQSGQIALVSNGYAPGAVGGSSGMGVGRGGRGVYNAAGEAGIFGGGGGGGSRTAGDSNGGAGGWGKVTIWY